MSSDATDPIDVRLALVEKALAGMSTDLTEFTGAFAKADGRLAKVEAAVEKLAKRPDPGDALARTVKAEIGGYLRQAADALHQQERRTREAENACWRRLHEIEARGMVWRKRLGWAAGGGVAAGIVFMALLLRVVPDGLSDRLYAAVTGQDRWDAGAMMMYRANPASFDALRDANDLVRRAGAEIDKCLKASEKAGKAVRCTLQIQPPQVAQKN
jgi:hypothetical protein